jgi:hypothetical protein
MINKTFENFKDIKYMKTKHISECSCGTHLIQTQYDEECKMFFLAIYYYSQKNIKYSIWSRIKFAMFHLFTGKLYDDQIVLDKKEAKKLATFINDWTTEETN